MRKRDSEKRTGHGCFAIACRKEIGGPPPFDWSREYIFFYIDAGLCECAKLLSLDLGPELRLFMLD
jgi:hypothetical protein